MPSAALIPSRIRSRRMFPHVFSLLLAGAMSQTPVLADSVPHLVKDINATGGTGSRLESPYRVGDLLFFIGADATHGSELWKSDGTAEGTSVVEDINPGSEDGKIRLLGQVDGALLFSVDDYSGRGLWRSDGTGEGTYRISEVRVEYSLMSGGLFWFKAQADPGRGIAGGAWRSDGTLGGTFALSEEPLGTMAPMTSIENPYPGGSYAPVNRIASVGDDVFFIGSGNGMLKSGGTPETTEALGTLPGEILNVNGFRSGDTWASIFVTSSSHDAQWWSWRGNLGNLVKLADGMEWINAYSAGKIGAALFAAVQSQDSRWSIWKSDGTPAGTVRVMSLPKTRDGASPTGFTSIGDKIYFLADGDKTGMEPWVTDGTDAGTRMLKDVCPGSSSSGAGGFRSHTGSVYFTAKDKKQVRIWKTDGTPKGTVATKIQPEGTRIMTSPIVILHDAIHFWSWDGYEIGLWKSDGTRNGTSGVATIRAGNGEARVSDAIGWGNSIVFKAFDGTDTRLWKSDGTESGTYPLEAPLKKYIYQWGAQDAVILRDHVLFVNTERTGKKRRILLSSDGSPLSAGLIPGIPAKSYPPGAGGLASSGEWGYFFATGYLWATGGDGGNTFQLLDLATMASAPFVESLTPAMGGGVYFLCQDRSLWKADAEGATTTLVKPGSSWITTPSNLRTMGDTLLFSVVTGGSLDIWSSDGTEGGTSKIKSFASVAYPSLFAVADDFMWFQVGIPSGSYELWCSDGTEPGTVRVSTFTQPVETVAPASTGGKLFFRYWDAEHGSELWISDGTAEGTAIVKDICPGEAASYPGSFAVVGDTVYFSAHDGAHGRELWKSDGTEAGTTMVADITGDSGSSAPGQLLYTGGRLFFDAVAEGTGRELYVLDVSEDLAPSVSPLKDTGH